MTTCIRHNCFKPAAKMVIHPDPRACHHYCERHLDEQREQLTAFARGTRRP